MKIAGIDVGSTTVKAVLAEDGEVRWQDYRRHHTRQAEMVLEFLERLEAECGFAPGRDRVFLTGSGAGLIAPLVGGKFVQEVVAVSAAVERLHPDVHFVSEIGGEDMKTLFFTAGGTGKSKQVFMQSACSGGTGTFIEKTARKLQIAPERLAQMPYAGVALHKVSAKCGIFAEADANTLVKSGVPVEEIIASLFEAVVYQNLATLTKGNTPQPRVLLLGGPNLFYRGLQEAWRHHLQKLWAERGVALPPQTDPASLVEVPREALYYACLGCVEIGRGEPPGVGLYAGTGKLRWWIEEGQHEQKAREGAQGLVKDPAELEHFIRCYGEPRVAASRPREGARDAPAFVGCDFGSTTAKAVVLSAERELLASCYVPSNGNPIEDAKAILREIRGAGVERIAALGITGYGKDLLKDIVGADVAIVETVAHATAALHFFPDADVICDVGGCDVKIMILRQGTVSDFRLNSQCSSGNGAFLQGVAERYGVPLEQYAEMAFRARAVPALAMGCGVFLQSDIVNQQRKGWSREEIMASLAAVLPLNVWVYAGQLQNLARRRPQVRAPRRHAPQPRGGEGAGRFHPLEGPRGRDRRASLLGRGGCDRRGAVRARLGEKGRAEPLPRLRRRRVARIPQHDQRAHHLPLVYGQLQAHLHRRAAARRARAPLEQGAARGGLGARDQRQLLPEGAARGRERNEGREGEAGGGEACLSQHC
ncbi:MAG: BadF/BadG/BcrA/BcrD ATPase family protein [Burkholderiales bacterium]|nr:BadF/BadG/BcrA/BcrD ATPase family protein [Burkholderiales bacterium]